MPALRSLRYGVEVDVDLLLLVGDAILLLAPGAGPNHGDDGSRSHVRDQTLEETLAGEVGVVLLEVLLQKSVVVLSSHS